MLLTTATARPRPTASGSIVLERARRMLREGRGAAAGSRSAARCGDGVKCRVGFGAVCRGLP
ncbi:hypothetical protein ACU4GD_19695 [Cupriavidus basilensis]